MNMHSGGLKALIYRCETTPIAVLASLGILAGKIQMLKNSVKNQMSMELFGKIFVRHIKQMK